ncbi:MAG: diaminopimelate decarboxylase [Candidatus Micropelagos thuwalensis]|nr:diaminopimelate decarboxylase [Candidatus Micropelagos thuwalensis]
MHHFNRREDRLFAENVDVTALAERIGTPFYCYSTATLRQHYTRLKDAFAQNEVTICYSVKANSNLGVIATLADLGSGADVVSEGELRRALLSGIPAEKIVFSGVGKTQAEMTYALNADIAQFNVESRAELEQLSEVATKQGKTARISLRVNPDIDAGTHEKISTGKAENKFGIAWDEAEASYAKAATLPGLEIVGIDIHIGSQITELTPFRNAFTKVADLLEKLTDAGHNITTLDLGGGLGIPYGPEDAPPPSPENYANLIDEIFGDSGCRIFLEPGRLIAGNAGILVTSVIRTKKGEAKNFIIVDAAMTELMRPTLYGAYHDIQPVITNGNVQDVWDVVGPVCETGDFLGSERSLPEPQKGDLLAIFTCGAYGASLGSSYNTRLSAPEVLVDNEKFEIIRARPQYDDILALEKVPDWLKKGGA